MDGPLDPEFKGELQRYLRRKRSAGVRIVHMESVAEPVRAAGTKEPSAPEPPVRAAAMNGENSNSIRFTYRPEGAAQASLFGGGGESDRPDIEKLDLESLERLVSQCRLCDLHNGRTQTVFGCGNPRARIIFIGEAPGREEDLQGIPFVGRAGKLLDKILASVELERDDVYIANILKCRPPNNRDPSEEESRLCKLYLWRQIELIKPALICALGRVAGQNLLETRASLGTLRGGEHYYNDIRVLVTYHPAALLRNPHWKRAAWEDIKKARQLYDEATG
jgi:DNA polymerase